MINTEAPPHQEETKRDWRRPLKKKEKEKEGKS